MANQMGILFKETLLTGVAGSFNDVDTLEGSIFSTHILWSNASDYNTLLTHDKAGLTGVGGYSTGRIKVRDYDDFDPPITVSSDSIVDCADITFGTMPSTGETVTYLTWAFNFASVASRVTMIAIDTAVGLPFITTGADVTVVWDNGTNKVFKL